MAHSSGPPAPAAKVARPPSAARGAAPHDSLELHWNEAFLQGVREAKLGPPMVARGLAIGHTCIYDAWAAYDAHAVGTRLGGALRRPSRERTLANINAAISFAAYRAAVDVFPNSRSTVFDPLMALLGYDPSDTSTAVSSAAGVGNLASRAVQVAAGAGVSPSPHSYAR